MNFSPVAKAWILLICLIVGSGGTVGLTAFLGGAHWAVALLSGVITGATNVYHALAASPREKAETAKPFPETNQTPSSP